MTATDPKAPAAAPAAPVAPAKPARKASAKAAAKASAKPAAGKPVLPRTGGKAAAPKSRPAKAAKPAEAAGPALQIPPLGTDGAAAAKPAKAAEPKKPKLVRDSFTIPRAEYQLLQDLKQRAASLGRPAKKSEVLRAGVMALAALDNTTFLAALAAVPVIKTGRPAKG